MSEESWTGEGGWLSAHLFHQGDLSTVLVDLVGPLVDELRVRALADHSFFLRYWDGGPHIRLRVLPRDPSVAAETARLIEDRVRAHFGRCPAPDVLSQEAYLRSAREIGAWEGVVPTQLMYPNNSVRFIPYAREYGRYGSGKAIEAVEEHFVESSALALAVLRTETGQNRRETAVLCYLMLAWFLASDDVLGLAWRQLAKAPPSADDARALYERQRTQVLTLAARMRTAAQGWRKLPAGSTLRQWASSVSRVVDLLRAHHDEDGGATPSAESVADLCAHLFANRIGIRIDAEGSLRYLAARAITEPAAPEGA